MTHSKSGITAEEVIKTEKDLYQRGYRQVGEAEEMEKRQFKITSHSSDADAAADEKTFDIMWCE